MSYPVPVTGLVSISFMQKGIIAALQMEFTRGKEFASRDCTSLSIIFCISP